MDSLWSCRVYEEWEQGEYETWGGHVCGECWEFHDLEGPCLPEHDLTTCGWALYRQNLFAKTEGETTWRWKTRSPQTGSR